MHPVLLAAAGTGFTFLMTALGASLVFFFKKKIHPNMQRVFLGFAAGVMIAASIWSLLIPAMEQSEAMGKLAFLPATIGFWLGIIFLLLIDTLMPHLHIDSKEAEGVKSNFKRTTMMVFAIIIHNIPEGMAVGVVYAGWISGNTNITLTAALALSIGIAIQNLPEGAIVSMPLCSEGCSKPKAFGYGFFSGIVEPIAALLTIALSSIMVPVLPYFLGFAAGAMLYVVVEELIPEMAEGEHTNLGTIMFAVGFSLMMVLDVALG